jgi:hypothetical protein
VAVSLLVVDVANVVGSRPDGWWRDRAGATWRLLRRLSALPGTTLTGAIDCAGVVAVVEGRARDVPAPAGVELVRATGSGDDALVRWVGERPGVGLLVVTADRELRGRLPEGTAVAGPAWLLAELDRIDRAPPA